LASSTSKKAQIWRFERDVLSGFVNPLTFLSETGVELLSLAGTVSIVPYSEIKSVHFVKEFDTSGKAPAFRAFLTRPKMDGLWVRMRFKDGESLEGVLTNDLLQIEPHGFTVTPPDYSYNNQRLFVPRVALAEIQVLGVVGSPLTHPKRKPKLVKDQIGLFE
jgi:hypothetical protein